ncbi:MAG: hypothetical protein Kow00104_17010 [Rhodothalassiaceae bacterium]
MTDLPGLPYEAMILILLYGLLFPAMAIAGRRRAEAALAALAPSDLPGFHRGQAALLAILGAPAFLPLATGAASAVDFGLGAPAVSLLVLAALSLVVLHGLALVARGAVRRYAAFRRFIRDLVPHQILAITPKDRSSLRSWTLLSLTAGFGEEAMFRAALPWALAHLISLEAAMALSALAFAAGHSYQGLRNSVIIFGIGLLFGALMIATGSLPFVMALHALYDREIGRLYYTLHLAGSSESGPDPT